MTQIIEHTIVDAWPELVKSCSLHDEAMNSHKYRECNVYFQYLLQNYDFYYRWTPYSKWMPIIQFSWVIHRNAGKSGYKGGYNKEGTHEACFNYQEDRNYRNPKFNEYHQGICLFLWNDGTGELGMQPKLQYDI